MKVDYTFIKADEVQPGDLIYLQDKNKTMLVTHIEDRDKTVILTHHLETLFKHDRPGNEVLLSYNYIQIDKKKSICKLLFPFANPILEKLLDTLTYDDMDEDVKIAVAINEIRQYMDDNPELTWK